MASKRETLESFAKEFLDGHQDHCWLSSPSDTGMVLRNVQYDDQWAQISLSSKKLDNLPPVFEETVLNENSYASFEHVRNPIWDELWWEHNGSVHVFPFWIVREGMRGERQDLRQLLEAGIEFVEAEGLVNQAGWLNHVWNLASKWRDRNFDDSVWRQSDMFKNMKWFGRVRNKLNHFNARTQGGYWLEYEAVIPKAAESIWGLFSELEEYEEHMLEGFKHDTAR